MKKQVTLLMAVIFLGGIISCSEKSDQEKLNASPTPKNVILLIGDGMGVSQIYAGMTVADKELVFEKFKHIGFQKTYSYSDYITDSGASGTALATGVKTNNQSIGVDPEGNPVKSILHYAEEEGLATGLVSTSAITHATPASFIAHNTDRGLYEDIALDFLETDVDVFIGGGYNHFAEREDGLNLIDSLEKRGYEVIRDLEGIKATQSTKIAALTAPKHNPSLLEGRGPLLPVASKKAIEVLSKDGDGFFLMIEGSQIDWAGHDMDIDYTTSEVIDFNDAVEHALAFAKQNKETLVIVTADHECGGLAIVGGSLEERTVEGAFPTDYHTAVMVPVFAYGPGAEEFQGIYENTDIFKKMMQQLGLK